MTLTISLLPSVGVYCLYITRCGVATCDSLHLQERFSLPALSFQVARASSGTVQPRKHFTAGDVHVHLPISHRLAVHHVLVAYEAAMLIPHALQVTHHERKDLPSRRCGVLSPRVEESGLVILDILPPTGRGCRDAGGLGADDIVGAVVHDELAIRVDGLTTGGEGKVVLSNKR